MTRFLIGLLVLGALATAGAAQAANPAGNVVYTRILYSNGSPCGSGSCQFISRIGNGNPWIVSTGSNTVYSIPVGFHFYAWPSTDPTVCGLRPCDFAANAFTGHWLPIVFPMPPTQTVSFYARQACPTPGAYHYSQTKTWYMDATDNNYVHWLGTLTLGQGCQTQASVPAG